MARAVALLDANVLYPARLRDLLIRLAVDGHYAARWSEQILDECFRNLAANRPDLPGEHLARTRSLMHVAVPDAMVVDFDHLVAAIELPDPGDRHVVAAAIVSGANLIVTANLADFPAPSLPDGLRVSPPDDFVLSMIDADIEAVVAVVETQAASLRHPPMTIAELLDGLAIVGLKRSAGAVRQVVQ